MADNIEVNQKSTMGTGATQIGVQNNFNGLSIDSVMDAAFHLFREYYPQLRDEISKELRQMVYERLQQIPPNKITLPSPRIVIPTLQNASITEEPSVREMYANLLANSMNATVKDGIHPSCVHIINQLCSDEAKLLQYFYEKRVAPTVTLRRENKDKEGIDVVINYSNFGQLAKCEKPLDINKYFNNLIRLGLIEQGKGSHLTDEKFYQPLENGTYLSEKATAIKKVQDEFNIPRFSRSYMFLTDFGQAFCQACVVRSITVTVLSNLP